MAGRTVRDRSVRVARVMAVDDDPVIRGLLEVNLEMEGHDVVTAVDGRDALDKVRADAPDLILLDVMMPNVNGWEAVAALKDDPATRSIPVILLSARAAEDDRRKGEEIGVEEYVTKPFDPIELMDLVNRLLQGKAAAS
jgi:CheY-like chemotaxis protein